MAKASIRLEHTLPRLVVLTVRHGGGVLELALKPSAKHTLDFDLADEGDRAKFEAVRAELEGAKAGTVKGLAAALCAKSQLIFEVKGPAPEVQAAKGGASKAKG